MRNRGRKGSVFFPSLAFTKPRQILRLGGIRKLEPEIRLVLPIFPSFILPNPNLCGLAKVGIGG